jgi:hypothetical protein
MPMRCRLFVSSGEPRRAVSGTGLPATPPKFEARHVTRCQGLPRNICSTHGSSHAESQSTTFVARVRPCCQATPTDPRFFFFFSNTIAHIPSLLGLLTTWSCGMSSPTSKYDYPQHLILVAWATHTVCQSDSFIRSHVSVPEPNHPGTSCSRKDGIALSPRRLRFR